jgi:hypothetical protein
LPKIKVNFFNFETFQKLGIKGYNKIKVLTNNDFNPPKAFAHFFGCPTQSSSMGLHNFPFCKD